ELRVEPLRSLDCGARLARPAWERKGIIAHGHRTGVASGTLGLSHLRTYPRRGREVFGEAISESAEARTRELDHCLREVSSQLVVLSDEDRATASDAQEARSSRP